MKHINSTLCFLLAAFLCCPAMPARSDEYALAPRSIAHDEHETKKYMLIGLLQTEQELAESANVDGFYLDPVDKVVWGARRDKTSGVWQRAEDKLLGPMPALLQAALQMRPPHAWQEPLLIWGQISPDERAGIAEKLLSPLLEKTIHPVAEGEVILGNNHLKKYIWVGDRTRTIRKAREILSHAEHLSDNAMVIGKGDSQIIPMLRKSGKQTVAVIKNMDVDRFAAHLGRPSKTQAPRIQDDEVVFSSTGLAEYFHAHNAVLDAELAKHKTPSDALAGVPDTLPDIPRYRRYSGNNAVTAIKRADIRKLAEKLPFPYVGHETAPHQIACTGYILSRFFKADKNTINGIIAKRLPEAATSTEPSIQRSGVNFVKGFSGKEPCWIMDIHDIRNLGTEWNLELKHGPLGKNEFACSGERMGDNFRWESEIQERKARAKLPDPYRVDVSVITYQDISLSKRWVMPDATGNAEASLEWAANITDKSMVADYLGLSPIFPESIDKADVPFPRYDEALISRRNLGVFFIDFVRLSRRVNALLPDPGTFPDNTFHVGNLTFYRRKFRTSLGWVIKERDLPRFAKKFKAKLRSAKEIDALRVAKLMQEYRPLVGDAVNVLLDPSVREKLIKIRQWEMEGIEANAADVWIALREIPIGLGTFADALPDDADVFYRNNSTVDITRKIQVAMMLAALKTAQDKRIFSTEQAIRIGFKSNVDKVTMQRMLFLMRLDTVNGEPFIDFSRAMRWATTPALRNAISKLLALKGRLPDIAIDNPKQWPNQIPLRSFLSRLQTQEAIRLIAKFSDKPAHEIRALLVDGHRTNENRILEWAKSLSHENVLDMRQRGSDRREEYLHLLAQMGPLLYSLRQEVRAQARSFLAEWHKDFLDWYRKNPILHDQARELYYVSLVNYNPYFLWQNGDKFVKRFDNYVRNNLRFVRHLAYGQTTPPELRAVIRTIRDYRKLQWEQRSEHPSDAEIAAYLAARKIPGDAIRGGLAWLAGMVRLDSVPEDRKESLQGSISQESLWYDDAPALNGNGEATGELAEDAILDPALIIDKLLDIAPETKIWLEERDEMLNLEGQYLSLAAARDAIERNSNSQSSVFLAMRYDNGEFILYNRRLAQDPKLAKDKVESIAYWRSIIAANKGFSEEEKLEAIYQLRAMEAHDHLQALLRIPGLDSTLAHEIVAALLLKKENLSGILRDPNLSEGAINEILNQLARKNALDTLRACVETAELSPMVRYGAVKAITEYRTRPGGQAALNNIAPLVYGMFLSEARGLSADHAAIAIDALAAAHAFEFLQKIAMESRVISLPARYRAIRAITDHRDSPEGRATLNNIAPQVYGMILSEARGLSADHATIAIDALAAAHAYELLHKIVTDARVTNRIREEALHAMGARCFDLFHKDIMRKISLRDSNESRLEITNMLLKTIGVNIVLVVTQVSELRAARGLVEAMEWGDQKLTISCAEVLEPALARREFTGDSVRVISHLPLENDVRNVHLVFSDVDGVQRSLSSYKYWIPLFPFKFAAPVLPSHSELAQLRAELHAGQRRIFVVGSPDAGDVETFLQAYSSMYGKLPAEQRPIVILAPRTAMEVSTDEGRRHSRLDQEKFIIRETSLRPDRSREPFPDMSAHNMLIVNTQGELRALYGIADVTMVGRDRNIMEPASQQKPILYFGDDDAWHINKEIWEALRSEGAILPFNQMNLAMLMNDDERSKSLGKSAAEVFEKRPREWIPAAREDVLDHLLPSAIWGWILMEEESQNLRENRPGEPVHPISLEYAA